MSLKFLYLHMHILQARNTRKLFPESFKFDETALVCDHAVYSKALEVVLAGEHECLKEFINLRMVGFHEK